MPLNILITGGFGYIGGRLAQILIEQGNDVYLGTRQKSNPPDWLPRANVVQMHWGMVDQLDSVCKHMDIIIHTAGMNAADCTNEPASALEFNGVCTARLLEAAIRQGVRRFIYLSTAHVYSSSLSGVITEKTILTNLHPYATSHRAGEDVVLRANQVGMIEGIVIRLSNSFGRPMHVGTNCWTLLFNDLCRQAVTKRAMILHSTGMQRRDFITLSDVCRAIDHLLQLPKKNLYPSVINIGGEWAPTVWDVAQLIQQQCEVVLNFQPTLSRVACDGEEQDNTFEYRSDLLSQSGFQRSADRTMEIQSLLQFCRISFKD